MHIPMKRFEDKVVIITGGARGIGKAAAQRFAAEGARVALFDLLMEEAQELAGALGGTAYKVDVTDPESVRRAVEAVLAEWERVDVLFANAGVYRAGPLPDVSLEEWNLVLSVNLTGVMVCSQAVAPAMMREHDGSIVVMSSMAAKTSWPASAAYSASKTGAVGLVRSVAQELGPYNVNCNALCLGHADTEMLRAVDRRLCEENGWEAGTYLRQVAETNPMRRLATLEEVAAVVAFLASPEARYINGQAIELDGGLIMC